LDRVNLLRGQSSRQTEGQCPNLARSADCPQSAAAGQCGYAASWDNSRSACKFEIQIRTPPTEVAQRRKRIAHGFNRGFTVAFESSPGGAKENTRAKFLSPLRGLLGFDSQIPQLKLRAIFGRAPGAAN
jgi:hypothetical protein